MTRTSESGREPGLPQIDLANVAGISEHFGVSRSAVSNWEARHDDYPAPLDLPHVVGIPLWDLDEVIRWRARHP